LALGASGEIYGTASHWGTHGYDAGAVYRLAGAAGGLPYDGVSPLGGVSLGPQGELFGTTTAGGVHGACVVFELAP